MSTIKTEFYGKIQESKEIQKEKKKFKEPKIQENKELK